MTTLAQWSKESGIEPATPPNRGDAVFVTIDSGHPDKNELWHLDDYIVSSASGMVVWLVLRDSAAKRGRRRVRPEER